MVYERPKGNGALDGKNSKTLNLNFCDVNFAWRVDKTSDLSQFDGPDETWGVPTDSLTLKNWVNSGRFLDTQSKI